MKRPILVVVIGYIIGIIIGLYFKFSIALLYLVISLITTLIIFIKRFLKLNSKRKFNLFSISRYFRYIKIFLNFKVICTIIIFSIISNTIVIFKNKQYDYLYKGIKTADLIAIVVSSKIEKEYKDEYKVKVIELNGSKKQKDTYLYLKVNKKYNLEYGSKIKVNGEFRLPETARNYAGFNYKEYLKTKNIYGIINANDIKVIGRLEIPNFNIIINNIKEQIKNNSKKYLKDDLNSIFLGIVLGDTSNLDEHLKEQFRNSNMSHILAVSGLHISYIIVGASMILNKILGKVKSNIITIFILMFYLLITGFSPSIVRAIIMAVCILISNLIHRKNDMWTGISLSLLIILIYNPYLITSVSLQYSYAGTIGIILFNKNILKILNRKKENKSKIKEIISISIASQMFILPLTIYHFNTIGIYFLLTNLLLNFLLGPIIIYSFIFLFLLILNIKIINPIIFIQKILIQILKLVSNISFLPLSNIYISTPKISIIVLFYIVAILINFLDSVKQNKNLNLTYLRIICMLQVLKYKYRKNRKSIIKLFCIFLLIIFLLNFFIQRDLKINFVDVGQGDCCFIVTPRNKTILIDGGGSESKNSDIGKNTLIPYILDRGYTKIDYIIISHFDTDHVGGLLTIMEELKVGQVIIGKQSEESENYKRFKKIVNEKRIKAIVIEKGDVIRIEKELYFDILWPNNSNLVSDNVLNNNSIVCKLHYKNFSMLFTGDIEEVAEKRILSEYKDNLQVLNSTVLKVGHHGSKTSSNQEFIKRIQPKIALIGVGENNKFGHPSNEVIERLENIDSKVYRTDKMGEIMLVINNKGKIKVNKFIEGGENK